MCVLAVQHIGPISTAQIIATLAALFAVIAGATTATPARNNATPQSLRNQFIIAAVMNFVACAFLITALALFAPYIWGIWDEANNTILGPHKLGYNHMDTGIMNLYNPYGMYFHDYYYHLRIVSILKLTALIGDAILACSAIVAFIICIMDILNLRGSHVPLSSHDVISIQGNARHEVLYQNTPQR